MTAVCVDATACKSYALLCAHVSSICQAAAGNKDAKMSYTTTHGFLKLHVYYDTSDVHHKLANLCSAQLHACCGLPLQEILLCLLKDVDFSLFLLHVSCICSAHKLTPGTAAQQCCLCPVLCCAAAVVCHVLQPDFCRFSRPWQMVRKSLFSQRSPRLSPSPEPRMFPNSPKLVGRSVRASRAVSKAPRARSRRKVLQQLT